MVSTSQGKFPITVTVAQDLPSGLGEFTDDQGNALDSPKSLQPEPQTLKIKLTGKHLQKASLIQEKKSGQAKLEVTDVKPDSVGKSLTATIAIPAGTPADDYIFRVKNDSEAKPTESQNVKLTIVPVDAPEITGDITFAPSDPTESATGKSYAFTINGQNLKYTKITPVDKDGKPNPLGATIVKQDDKKIEGKLTVPKGEQGDFDFKVSNLDTTPKDTLFTISIARQGQIKVTVPTEAVTPGEKITLTGQNLEGFAVDKQDVNWEIEVVGSATSTSVQIIIKRASDAANQPPAEAKIIFKNLRTKTSEVTIPIKVAQ